MKEKTSSLPYAVRVVLGLVLTFALALLAWWITKKVYGLTLPGGIPGKALEYPLWGAIIGLLGNIILRLTHLKDVVRPGFRMELFLKIGLVLLGASINMALLAPTAGGAVLQALIMITCVVVGSYSRDARSTASNISG